MQQQATHCTPATPDIASMAGSLPNMGHTYPHTTPMHNSLVTQNMPHSPDTYLAHDHTCHARCPGGKRRLHNEPAHSPPHPHTQHAGARACL